MGGWVGGWVGGWERGKYRRVCGLTLGGLEMLDMKPASSSTHHYPRSPGIKLSNSPPSVRRVQQLEATVPEAGLPVSTPLRLRVGAVLAVLEAQAALRLVLWKLRKAGRVCVGFGWGVGGCLGAASLKP